MSSDDPATAPSTREPKIGPLRWTAVGLFTVGLVALGVIPIAGAVVGFDAFGWEFWTGVGTLVVAGLWSLGGDARSWLTAGERLSRNGWLPRLGGLAKSEPLVKSEPLAKHDLSAAPADPAVIPAGDDQRRLDRRRITRLVAEAQARDRKLKNRD